MYDHTLMTLIYSVAVASIYNLTMVSTTGLLNSNMVPKTSPSNSTIMSTTGLLNSNMVPKTSLSNSTMMSTISLSNSITMAAISLSKNTMVPISRNVSLSSINIQVASLLTHKENWSQLINTGLTSAVMNISNNTPTELSTTTNQNNTTLEYVYSAKSKELSLTNNYSMTNILYFVLFLILAMVVCISRIYCEIRNATTPDTSDYVELTNISLKHCHSPPSYQVAVTMPIAPTKVTSQMQPSVKIEDKLPTYNSVVHIH